MQRAWQDQRVSCQDCSQIVARYYTYFENQKQKENMLPSFYDPESLMIRRDGDSTQTASNIDEIKAILTSLDFVEIRHKTYCQESHNESVFASVVGSLRIKGLSGRRKFAQTLFLVRSDSSESTYKIIDEFFCFIGNEPDNILDSSASILHVPLATDQVTSPSEEKTVSTDHDSGSSLGNAREHENGVADTEHENGVADTEHENGVAVKEQKNGVADTEHENGAADTEHETGIADTEQKNGVANTDHENGAADTEHENGVADTEHENGVADTEHENGVANTEHETGVANTENVDPVIEEAPVEGPVASNGNTSTGSSSAMEPEWQYPKATFRRANAEQRRLNRESATSSNVSSVGSFSANYYDCLRQLQGQHIGFGGKPELKKTKRNRKR